MIIRPTLEDDLPDLQKVLAATGLFPPGMLPQMYRASVGDGSGADIWLSATVDGDAVGFCYAEPETLADGTWNMLAIAVRPDAQGKGCGGELCAALEATLAARGQRVLIAETSGTDGFAATRAFYLAAGYSEEARIRDFWGPGDDKVVFWKSLA